jgi:hypothetical protein
MHLLIETTNLKENYETNNKIVAQSMHELEGFGE